MSRIDQADGLRRWAESQPQADIREAGPSRVMMVLGLPDGAESDVTTVTRALRRWHEQGQRWVGEPDAWRVVAMDPTSPHLAVLAKQQSRWALWVGDDPDGFRRAYRVLKQLAQRHGPHRLLLVHPQLPSRAGLLDNLQQAAAQFFGIQLLVVGFSRRRCTLS